MTSLVAKPKCKIILKIRLNYVYFMYSLDAVIGFHFLLSNLRFAH